MSEVLHTFVVLLSFATLISIGSINVIAVEMAGEYQVELLQNGTSQIALENETKGNVTQGLQLAESDNISSNATHGCYPICSEEVPTIK